MDEGLQSSEPKTKVTTYDFKNSKKTQGRGRGKPRGFNRNESRGQNTQWRRQGGSWNPNPDHNGRNRNSFKQKDGQRLNPHQRQKMFPGRRPLDPKILKQYDKGTGVDPHYMRGQHLRSNTKRVRRAERKIKAALEETARVEILLTENTGLMEAEELSKTAFVTQKDIKSSVDITTAAKGFELNLNEFGPYKMQYTRNGRHLLLGGRKGHLAALDWITKKLHFEINVMESIHDMCWLHTEHMLAVAQKKWVYMYDSQGVELHCLRTLHNVHKLEYLPYHFLLCTAGEAGFLHWLDISLGAEMLKVHTGKGRLEVMRQNPYNAVICCGHENGVVTMWTPNEQKAVASVLCHNNRVTAIEFDPAGRCFATASLKKEVKLWDARNLGESMHTYHIRSEISNLAFSQKQLLAVGMGNYVEVYDRVVAGDMGSGTPYMRYKCDTSVTGMQFCPYEDILGVSTYKGYSSLIVPGAGEPNFDALEVNPYISTSGRREAEVKSLLGKVPHQLITMDPYSIGQVDVPTLQEKLEARRNLTYVKTPKIDVKPRYRMKGKSGSAQQFKRKQQTKEALKKEYLKSALKKRDELGLKPEKKNFKKDKAAKGLLGRFNSKVQG